MDIFKKSFAISTHYLVYGAPQALREYLIKNKVQKLLFIAHPLQIDDNQSYFEIIKKGKLSVKKFFPLRTKISILNYLIEFFLTLYWVLFSRGKYNFFIGVDNLNAFAGIILRAFKKVDKVVYYTIDYSPKRFQNKFLNYFYHKIDNLCVKYANVVWNVSPRIAEGRLKTKGLNFLEKQKVVPIGVWTKEIKRVPWRKVKQNQLVFVGHLLEKQGVQMVVRAIPLIIKEVPNFHFLIIGGGEYEDVLKRLAKEMGVSQYVTFTGWIKDRKQLEKKMRDSALAVALYEKKKASFTYYADPTKIKDYLSLGIPVLLTDVPYNAKELERKRCGVVIGYSKESVAHAVVKLMKNESTLRSYRENAIKYIQQFDWKEIFSIALTGL
jgi:glycosyltransferase involved in cell wall biosynthesis